MADLLITGSAGQLGRALGALAPARGLTLDGRALDMLDITDPAAVAAWVTGARPRAVVNCAAYTAVDACEEHEAEALAVNAAAVGHLASACNRVGALLVQVSTDYVFDGTATTPYREDHPVAPMSAYGRTKLAGEVAARAADRHLVVRTAWLYGVGGTNFVEAIRRQVATGAAELKVVADQTGSPTFCADLARALLDLVAVEATGVVHAVNDGVTTWHGFATEIVHRLGSALPVRPVTTAEYPRPARRPPYSVLATDRLAALVGHRLPPWQDALRRYLEATCAS